MTNPEGDPLSVGAQQREVVNGLLEDRISDVWDTARALGGPRLFVLLAATSAAVAYRIWPTDPAPEDIPVVARQIADQMPQSQPVAPVYVEAAIRGALGDSEAVRGVSADALMPAYLLLIKTGVQSAVTDPSQREAIAKEILEALDG